MYFPDVVCCAAAYNCAPTLIQQNVDGSDFFNRSWEEFRIGFGSPSGNYWLGLDQLSQLTMSGRYKVTFDLQSNDTGTWYYAEYSTFRVLSEADNYRLAVAGYSGNAGDAFTRHSGSSFSTYCTTATTTSCHQTAAQRQGAADSGSGPATRSK